MNFNPFKLKTNSWFLISAIILMVSFYLFYFEFYVKNSEERIITAHFRALDQMGVNIDKKLNVYIHNANDLSGKVKGVLKIIKKDSSKVFSPSRVKQLVVDTLNKRGDFNKNIRVVEFIPTDADNSYLQTLKSRSLRQNYYFTVAIADSLFKTEKKNSSMVMVLEAPYDRLIRDLQRDDVFDGLIVVRDTNIIFNTIGQQLLFSTVSGDTEAESKTSSSSVPMLHSGRIMGGEVFDISISNIAYKAFIKPVKVNNDNWFVIGLIETKNFNAASRSIEPWIIITLSMLLIFIILGLPVIKLKVLSITEQLDTKNIIDYALFVMLGGVFAVMFLSFMVQNSTHRQSINNKLTLLSNSIDSTFRDEIDKAYHQLECYDSSFHAMNFPINPYNSDVRINILSDSLPYYPKHYPYGDYYFWTNPKGIQTNYLTPISTYGKLSDLSSRDYVNKKDEWFYPGSSEKKFRLQSIVSITSGTAKAAISKKGLDSKRPVVAVSSKMHSIINTILPISYSFCIIDKTGKVWFHSNQSMNLKENFVEECNGNKYLKAAMYANISKTINTYYYNAPCRIHIKRLDNLPLYLITIYNKKSEKSFQAEVITFTLLFIGVSLFVIFLQILALLIIEIHLKQTFSRNLLVRLTMPIKRLNGRYLYLIKLNLTISLLTMAFLFFYADMVALTSIVSLIIILFTYSYWLLNQNKTKTKQKKWFGIFNIFLLLIATVTGLFIAPTEKLWQIFLFDAAVVLTITIAHNFVNRDASNNSRYWTNYTLLLVTILLIMGLIPALKFYEMGYNNESELRARHKLLDLKNQREERNAKILSFYDNVNLSNRRDSIVKQRESLGIYTGFDNDTRYLKQRASIKGKIISGDNQWDTLYCYVRPFYDKSIVENKYLTLNNPTNNNLTWYRYKNRLTLKYNSLTEHINQTRIKPYYITTTVRRMSFITPFNSINNSWLANLLLNVVFWILIILILYIFFKLLKFGIYRIFNHNIIRNYLYQGYEQKLKQLISVNRNLFIVRQSQSDETLLFLDDFLSLPQRKQIDWATAKNISRTIGIIDDFKKKLHGEAGEEIKPEILITGFEKDFNCLSLLDKKISRIKLLLNRDDIKLIVLSQVSLTVITESYRSELAELSDKSSAPTDDYVRVINELNYISSFFEVNYIPVRYLYPKSFENDFHKSEPVEVTLDKRIEKELSVCDYLLQLKPSISEIKNQCPDELGKAFSEEILIEKILVTAERFYEEIYSSCSSLEKYILLDFSHDSIINPKNEKAIYSLLDKGLLTRKCYKISLMNKSFQRFLVSKLSMLKELEAELNKGSVSGTWQGYRVTLILIIVSLFAFITMANQDFLDNLNRLFVAIGGGVAVITGIIGLLSHKRKATKS